MSVPDQLGLLRMIAELEAHGGLEDPWGRSIKSAIISGYALASDHAELQRRAIKLQRQQLFGDVCPFRTPKLAPHGICLGKSPDSEWVYHDLSAAATHIAYVGATGSGKTSVLVWLLTQLILNQVGVLAIENYKADLRSLLPIAHRCGHSGAVITHRELRWNPLEPDGTPPRQHIEITVSLLARLLQLPDRAAMLFRKIAHECCVISGVFEGRCDRCPTLFHIFERARVCDANAQAREALLDRLGSLLMALGPGVLAYHRGWCPSAFLDRITVLELGGANELVRQFVPAAWLGTMFRGQINRGAQNARLRTLCLVDDAQRFLGGDGIGSSDQTPISELLGLLRTSGIGLTANVQSFEGIAPGTLANMTGRIIGRLGVSQDWLRAARECGLDQSQLAWIQSNLKPGRFMMQFMTASDRRPFIVDIPRPELPSVDAAMIERSVRALDAIPVIPAPEFAHWSPWNTSTVTTRVPRDERPNQTDHPKTQDAPRASTPRPLSDHEFRLLRAIVETPFKPMSSYHTRCGIKPADAKRARESLLARGLIAMHKARIKSRGRQPLLLEPTEAGIEALAADPRQK